MKNINKIVCCFIVIFYMFSNIVVGYAKESCYSEVSLSVMPFSYVCENPTYVFPDTEYVLSFTDTLDASSVVPTVIYLNYNELPDSDVNVKAKDTKLFIRFNNSALLAGTEYRLETNGIKDTNGNFITVPPMYLRAAGNIPVDWETYIKKGFEKVRFNGKVNGTVCIEANVTNNTMSDLSVELICEVSGENTNNVNAKLFTIKTGEKKTLTCEVDVTKSQDVFAYIRNSDGTQITERFCVTEKTTPISYYLIDDRFASTIADPNGTPLFSGWKINPGKKAANKVNYSAYSGVSLNDTARGNSIIMEKSFLSQSDGILTLETGFTPNSVSGQFEIFLDGYRNNECVTALKISTTRSNVTLFDGINRVNVALLNAGNAYNFKITADLNKNTFTAYLNGKLIMKNAEFIQTADFLNNIKISTPGEGVMDVKINYLKLYKNYGVNESFMCVGNEIDEWSNNTDNVCISKQYGVSDNDVNCLALGNAASFGTIEKIIDFIPERPEFSMAFKLEENSALNLSIFGNNNLATVLNGKLLIGSHSYQLKNNVWYTLNIKKYDDYAKAFINGIYLGNVNMPFVNSKITISGTYGVCVDDICVKETNNTNLTVDKSNDDGYDLHMMTYPMWNEGSHYGWDRISEYSERIPLMGFYDDCNEEAMNLQIKWLAEHSIDVMVFPFVQFPGNINSEIKNTQRDDAICAYKKAELSENINYAIMWSAINASSFGGRDDFRNNIVPYWIEHYFKDNKYATVGNKPILYIYNPDNLIDILGGTSFLKQELDYLDQEVKKIGYDGVYTIVNPEGKDLTGTGIDSLFTYAVSVDGGVSASQMQTINTLEAQARAYGTNAEVCAYMGFDSLPWRENSEGKGTAITPCTFKSYLTNLKENKLSSEVSQKILYLGAWNEFGEGHYFMPTQQYGFSYLDIIREVFGGDDENHTHIIPNYAQRNRYGTMYTKLGTPSRRYEKPKESNLDFTQVVKGWYFENEQDRAEWNIKYADKSVGSEGKTMLLTYNNAKSEPEMDVDISSLGIKADDVRFIRVTMKAELAKIGGKNFVMHFTTDEEPKLYSNSSAKFCMFSDQMRTIIIDMQGNSDWKGTLKEIHIWPVYVLPQNCIMGAKCEIAAIEFLK